MSRARERRGGRSAIAALVVATCASCASPPASRPVFHAPLEPAPLDPRPFDPAPTQLRFAHDPWQHRGLSRYDDGWEEWGNFMLYERRFRDTSLSGDAEHFGVGLELAGAPYGSWLAYEFGLWGSASEATWTRWTPVFNTLDEDNLEVGESGSRSFEVSLGVRKEYRPFDGPFIVYAGLGAAMVQLEEAVNDGATFTDDSDADLGMYAHWGAFVDFNGNGGLGFDARFVEGTQHRLFDRNVSGDYAQVALLFSFWF